MSRVSRRSARPHVCLRATRRRLWEERCRKSTNGDGCVLGVGQQVCNFTFHRIGPHLAKADFSATESQRRKKSSQNQCAMPTDTCTDPVGSRNVRPVHRERSLEHTGRVNRCKSWCIKAKCVV